MMKKVIAIAVLGVFVLASCKKDYTCECSVDGETINLPYNKQKKKDAEAACDAAETTYKMGDPDATCTLK